MTSRVEEFALDGKNFIYYDLSNIRLVEEYEIFIEEAKLGIVKYPKHSLMTISNLANILYDTRIKELLTEWTAFNTPFVKCGAVIGVNGIKQIFVNSIFSASGRSNLKYFHSKDQAVKWLLKQ
jgi:hypothetical protein